MTRINYFKTNTTGKTIFEKNQQLKEKIDFPRFDSLKEKKCFYRTENNDKINFMKSVFFSKVLNHMKERENNLREDFYIESDQMNLEKLVYIFDEKSLHKNQRQKILEKIENDIINLDCINFIVFLNIIKRREKLNGFIKKNIRKMRIDQLEYVLNEEKDLTNEQQEDIKKEINRIDFIIKENIRNIVINKDKMFIDYTKKEEMEWIERMREKDFITIENIKTLILSGYASKLLLKFKIEKIKKLEICCKDELQIYWIKEISKKLQTGKIKEIECLYFESYAINVLMKMKVDKIGLFSIWTWNKKHFDWIKTTSETIQIKKIKVLCLYDYELNILKKIEVEKIDFLIVSCYKKDSFGPGEEFIKNIKVKEIKNLKLNNYASTILPKLDSKIINVCIINCTDEDQLK